MSLEPNGDIVITRHDDFRGGVERYSYEWEGGGPIHYADIVYANRAGSFINIVQNRRIK